MATRPLTGQQQNVLHFVEEFFRSRGFPPTLREIGAALGLASINAVRGHLAALERKGYIVRAAEKARSIRVVRSPSVLSRVKRRLHEVLHTNEGLFHRVVYGLAWTTRNRRPWIEGPAAHRVNKALDREAIEHGWNILDRRVEPDHIIVVVVTWPNHSPAQVVRRFQSISHRLRDCRPDLSDRRIWGEGYAATTELEMLETLVAHLLESQPKDG
jgi:REP element-mobilizing transposase RayT